MSVSVSVCVCVCVCVAVWFNSYNQEPIKLSVSFQSVIPQSCGNFNPPIYYLIKFSVIKAPLLINLHFYSFSDQIGQLDLIIFYI